MGLFDFFKKMVQKPKKEASIIILGLDNAGKTTILKSLCNEDIKQITPTEGFNVKQMIQGNLNLKLWDVGGQKSIRPYWRNYFDGANALVYVVDSFDKNRLDESGLHLENLMEEEKLNKVPLLVFATKQDVEGALSAKDIALHMNLQAIRDRKWQIQACSGTEGTGIQEGIEWLISQL